MTYALPAIRLITRTKVSQFFVWSVLALAGMGSFLENAAVAETPCRAHLAVGLSCCYIRGKSESPHCSEKHETGGLCSVAGESTIGTLHRCVENPRSGANSQSPHSNLPPPAPSVAGAPGNAQSNAQPNYNGALYNGHTKTVERTGRNGEKITEVYNYSANSNNPKHSSNTGNSTSSPNSNVNGATGAVLPGAPGTGTNTTGPTSAAIPGAPGTSATDQKNADNKDAASSDGKITANKKISITNAYSTQGRGTGDRCSTADRIDHKYGCDSTVSSVEMARMGNILTQTTGSMATQVLGQNSQMRAYQSGSQSGALEAAATTAETTGKVNVGLGLVNGAAGIMQIWNASKLKKNAREISSQATGAGLDVVKATADNAHSDRAMDHTDAGWVKHANENHLQNKIIHQFDMNKEAGIEMTVVKGANDAQGLADRNYQGQRVLDQVKQSVRRVANDAAGEQKSVSSMAMQGGMMSMVTGITQGINGAMSILAAKQLRKAADELNKPPPAGNIPYVTPPALPNNLDAGTQNGGGGPKPITGNGINSDGAAASTDAPPGDPPSLGNPINPTPLGSGLPGGPPAGKFNAGNPPESGAPAAANLGMGGNTAPSTASNEDPQAKLAPNERGNPYESGGTFGGGGGGGGRGAEGGPDLSGLMDKLLPKEKEAAPQNGIVQFGSQGPGGEQPFSVLDKNTNIFERIHETYQDKNRQGRI